MALILTTAWRAIGAALLALTLCTPASVAATSASTAAARGETVAGSSEALRARYAQLRPRLEHNAFGQPLYLASQEGPKLLQGDVYGVVDHPFREVDAALAQAQNWCDILILPFNVKSCTTSGASLSLWVGRKSSEPIERAFRLDFRFLPIAQSADYLERSLRASEGPLGTRNYAITLEAAPIDEAHSFIHLTYAYEYGTVSRLAMQLYLSTAGAEKVGFSTTDEEGRPRLVGGMRGVMERNTMRYYLAIDAYLNSLAAPAGERVRRRLDDWFSMTEKYRRQLHEMDREEYLAMKLDETRRMAQR